MHVFSHFPYIVNLAGKKGKKGEVPTLAWDGDDVFDRKLLFAIKELQYELSVLSNFNGKRNGVVIHPGNFPDSKKGLKAIAKSINKIEFTEDAKLILENSAGQGTSLATTLKEIRTIFKYIDDDKQDNVGVCIDTCHLHAYGDYDLTQISEVDRFFDDFERILGMERFTLLHLNDSHDVRGARKDNHACLGDGQIWGESFDSLVHLLDKCQSFGIPMILETHGLDMVTLACLQ
jgi:apurinic endonuclease APN1